MVEEPAPLFYSKLVQVVNQPQEEVAEDTDELIGLRREKNIVGKELGRLIQSGGDMDRIAELKARQAQIKSKLKNCSQKPPR